MNPNHNRPPSPNSSLIELVATWLPLTWKDLAGPTETNEPTTQPPEVYAVSGTGTVGEMR